MKKKSDNKTPLAPTNEVQEKVTLKISYRELILPLLGLLCFLFIFSEMYQPNIQDSWYKGGALCDKAAATKDSVMKRQYLEEGGAILRNDVNKFPYHARIWYMLGYYYLLNKQLDSSIYCEKQAIEKGAGGIVNQIEFKASEILNNALGTQLSAVNYRKDTSLILLEQATTKNFYNPAIDKYKGFVYANSSDFEPGLEALNRYLSYDPKDFMAVYAMAVNYNNHGDLQQAREWALKAQKINPNSNSLNGLLAHLNSVK